MRFPFPANSDRHIGRWITASIDRAEALRRAMFLDIGAPQEGHPAYWAPFIVKALVERFVWIMLADLMRNFNEAAHHPAAERS